MNTTLHIKEYALDLGYSRIGITGTDDFAEYAEELRSRGDLYDFFTGGAADPLGNSSIRRRFPEAKSVIVLVRDYFQTSFPPELVGKVGRVYQARSYNPPVTNINGARLETMKRFLRDGGIRIFDGAFVPERWAAARAGVATFGKNNFAYADGIGSFIVISSIVTDAELEPDEPTVVSKCPEGCTRCIDACPSKALYAPFRMNPRRCLAFNAWKTTEKAGFGMTDSMPRDLRAAMGQQVHGCDLCQEACPRNQAKLRAKLPEDEFLKVVAADFSLAMMLHLDEEFYLARVFPLMSNYIRELRFFQRNAAVAIGNTGDPAYLPDLERELAHPDEAVREHVAWAIGRIGGREAKAMLLRHRETETSRLVLGEIELTLREWAEEPVAAG